MANQSILEYNIQKLFQKTKEKKIHVSHGQCFRLAMCQTKFESQFFHLSFLLVYFSSVHFKKIFIYFIGGQLLYNIVVLFAIINMNQPWVYMGTPHPEPPSHLPAHPIPQGHPSALALSALSHASNLDWRSISHMVIYMFQCYSLKSSHTPTESKSLFFTSVSLLLSRIQGHHYSLSKLHIYALVHCIGVFLSGLLHSV